jgi:hypothetical protein
MAYRMKKSSSPTDLTVAPQEGAPEADPTVEMAMGDEPGDISEQEGGGGLEYIKEFVSGLDATELAYLKSCVSASDNAQDRPEYKKPEAVKDAMDAEMEPVSANDEVSEPDADEYGGESDFDTDDSKSRQKTRNRE